MCVSFITLPQNNHVNAIRCAFREQIDSNGVGFAHLGDDATHSVKHLLHSLSLGGRQEEREGERHEKPCYYQ